MPIRPGKSMRRVLKRMAINQRQGVRVDFLIRGLTAIERKAIRQLIKMHKKEDGPVAKGQFGWCSSCTSIQAWQGASGDI